MVVVMETPGTLTGENATLVLGYLLTVQACTVRVTVLGCLSDFYYISISNFRHVLTVRECEQVINPHRILPLCVLERRASIESHNTILVSKTSERL